MKCEERNEEGRREEGRLERANLLPPFLCLIIQTVKKGRKLLRKSRKVRKHKYKLRENKGENIEKG